MSWSFFFMLLIAFAAGAHVYGAGRAGASLFQPVSNLIQRASEAFSRRHAPQDDNGASIAPKLRS